MTTDYQRFTNSDDRKCVNVLLQTVVDEKCGVSVFDGEEWTLDNSSDISEIKQHLATTGHDVIRLHKDGAGVGSFSLIYNNGSEGEPMVVISDYSDSGFCESIYQKVEAAVG